MIAVVALQNVLNVDMSALVTVTGVGGKKTKKLKKTGHNFIGHNYLGYDYIGHIHHYTGHNHIGLGGPCVCRHACIGHSCMGHSCMGHSCMGHSHRGQTYVRWEACMSTHTTVHMYVDMCRQQCADIRVDTCTQASVRLSGQAINICGITAYAITIQALGT